MARTYSRTAKEEPINSSSAPSHAAEEVANQINKTSNTADPSKNQEFTLPTWVWLQVITILLGGVTSYFIILGQLKDKLNDELSLMKSEISTQKESIANMKSNIQKLEDNNSKIQRLETDIAVIQAKISNQVNPSSSVETK